MYPLGGPRFREGPKKVHSGASGKHKGLPFERRNGPTGIEGNTVSARDVRTGPFAFALEFSTLITSFVKEKTSTAVQRRYQGWNLGSPLLLRRLICFSPDLSEEPTDLEVEAFDWESPKGSTFSSSYESSWVP